MNSYPADEQRIWEVERGRSCEAVVALPPDGLLAVGDSILFALASSEPSEEPRYIKGGDSVRVLLTVVTDLGEADPVTGRALFRLAWEPLGRIVDPPAGSGRASRSRGSRGGA
jgi:hypothetical protein